MNNLRNMILGICEITDGFVRFITLGFVHTMFAFNWLAWWELNVVIKQARKRMLEDD